MKKNLQVGRNWHLTVDCRSWAKVGIVARGGESFDSVRLISRGGKYNRSLVSLNDAPLQPAR